VNGAARGVPDVTILPMSLLASVLIAGALFETGPRPHFDVTASFTAARRDAPGEVAVQFVARDPDVKINEVPAPRLKLSAGPATVVVPPRAAGAKPAPGADTGQYLDLTLPVTFPVTLDPAAAAGPHQAKGTVTYFYCSKREGWCRKGTAEVAFPIAVP
jgi:hypothetical protein